MKRVLLLIPTTSYRTQAFLEAAHKLGVEITVCSELPNIFADRNRGGLLTLDFANYETAVSRTLEFVKTFPVQAVVGVDDETTEVAARIAESLGLRHNSVAAVSAARNKYRMRELLRKGSVPTPPFALHAIDDDPAVVARGVRFPCVVKPLMLSGSRGVIRANNEEEFLTAFHRLVRILHASELGYGDVARRFLVEDFIPGIEVALEGVLVRGALNVLAIFDKPDPLDGPFFEETIYITPSRLSRNVQQNVILCAIGAIRALGLTEGPVHVEIRHNEYGPWVVEVAARSIGGFCSRALRFDQRLDSIGDDRNEARSGLSLEELILRHALGKEIGSIHREVKSSGVMMIPIPHGGVLNAVRGLEEAQGVEGIDDIIISAHHGEMLIPLPEGGKYLGFIFSRANSPEKVEKALREAHQRLEFIIETVDNVARSDNGIDGRKASYEVSY